MNLADSLKHVLKNKSQNILSDFWKRDLKVILTSFGNDIGQMYKSGAASLKNLKETGAKLSVKEMGESLTDAFLIVKVLPGRIKEAFIFFKDDLLLELDNQPDAKQKAIFSFKILGALTSFILGIIYNVKRGQTEINLKGLKTRNAFTKFIVAELIFKITQHFFQRFLQELETELTDPEDIKNIRYFRQLLSDRSELPQDSELDPSDKSIEIVENFRNYILTGKRIKT
jgi:hypothetical protein